MSDLVRGQVAPPPAPAQTAPAKPATSEPARREVSPARIRLASLAGESAPRATSAATEGPAATAEPSASAESPGAAEPSAEVGAADADELSDSAERLFGEIASFLGSVPELVRTGSSFPWSELEALMERAQRALGEAGELFWIANRTMPRPGVEYLAFHQARVGVLAMRVGANIGYDRRRLVEVGIAGCLIDAGLWQAPAALLRRLEALSPEEQAQYRAHPGVSADIVRRWAPPYEGLVEMILQHHEREQGQGFPNRLTGASIRPEAKLLGLIDTYTGLTAPPSLRAGFRPHEAIREIVRSKHESFPPALIKALLSEISVFPPGTLVRLNSGEMGCVVAVNRNHPLRPRVEVYDAKGRRLSTPKTIDLSETPFLYITGPVSEGGS